MKSKLADAFEEASQGYSADRVVADPALNSQFILACGRRGLSAPVAMLNRSLLNLRKQGGLRGRRRSKRTHFANEDEYRFAAEMAARFLERRDGVSLDDIISDAERVAEFDELAASTAPGHSALQYRWAALNLRKGKRLEPELVARISPPVEILSYRADEIKLAELPSSPGVYLFFASHQLLYVGETENLRARLKKHLDHSDNRGLARWMWEFGTERLYIEVQVLERSTLSRVRKALELELIRSRQPILNVKR